MTKFERTMSENFMHAPLLLIDELNILRRPSITRHHEIMSLLEEISPGNVRGKLCE